ncbi:DUF6250 domain-containing protein [Sphingomonas sp.]|uniref:DUF6250 domain-containing protein n=1 Tax=Sphingomonas sp. TaxID=28214 RepID=UPI0031D20021
MAVLAPACAGAGRRGERVIHRDDFRHGLGQWIVEAERPGRFTATDGVLDIDSPAGVTLWFREPLESPVAIEYVVTAVAAGGPNDQVSDINCFWMATDARARTGDIRAHPRSGAFADYDALRTYYAGIGGNRNTSSRFRRYVGRTGDRPLLPQHDLSAPADLIEANRAYHIRLEALGSRITLLRDGRPMFRLDDAAPYTRGHFGLRTTASHLRVKDFRVLRP